MRETEEPAAIQFLNEFLDRHCEIGVGSVNELKLFDIYVDWCKEKEYPFVGFRRLERELDKHGIGKEKKRGQTYRVGIKLRDKWWYNWSGNRWMKMQSIDLGRGMTGFLEECCVIGPQHEVGATELYRAYCGWCGMNKTRPWSQRRFGIHLTERGIGSVKRSRIYRVGIALRHVRRNGIGASE